HETTCNSRPFDITGSLLAALKAFRRTQWKMLWVDQVCINQADMAERSSQVSLMELIYSHALRVFIYLGDAHPNIGEGLHFL
ncbi:hypothetical protein BDZ45DRAFT_541143, partial [Acephala macrosclerotiorum]